MRMDRVKVVQDPIHGSISLDGPYLSVMDRHEMQRLRSVRQLGLSNLVFPGANHTRFEHCLGTYHLAGRMADVIGLDRDDSATVRMAGLLHDVCHPPFSHALEAVMERATGLDHMELARALINGRIPNHRSCDSDMFGDSEPMSEIMSRFGISTEEVCDLIEYPVTNTGPLDTFMGSNGHFPSHDYAHQIIHGPVDADQMDYLMRDAYYTGIVHGSIDCERLINTMRLQNDRIVIRRGGMVAAEGLMVSRALIYTSLYFHETVKIAERMLEKAVCEYDGDLSEIYLWSDADLVSNLRASGGKSSMAIRRIMNRDIDKKAFAIYNGDATQEILDRVMLFSGKGGQERLESEIADVLGVDPFDICVVVAPKSSLQSRIKIGKTDVAIADDEGRVRPITRFSPLARSLQSRDTHGWSLVVASSDDMREKVARATRKVLGL